VGDGLDRVMEAVAVLSAVAEDLVVLQAADDVFHAGADLAMGGVVVLLAREQSPSGAFSVRYRHAAVEVGPVPSTVTPSQCRLSPDARQAWASAVVPGTGRAAAITSRVSASTTICTFTENR